ncbi:hypothetical protein [Alteromonas halophila]|uniref:Lipoprotein n=1 Tax=Alteromonas halophila TaxID=516698 RepID=A0A918JF85_9ALTE|nr:hypothetical protein [Alteromonas halophila]GGW78281.1 hypothetical protein GCM10007391_08560 [Alteromonas halophila]
MLRKQQSRFYRVILVIMLLTGCASGPDLRPGNPLPGIGLEAAEDTVLLSWSNQGPLARNLQPGTQVNVLAQYDTQYGPVTNEILASTTVRSGINGVKLPLKDALNFSPSGPVCLRLAIGQRPIPVRIARLDESSSGFYYPEWAKVAALEGEKAALQVQLRTVSTNIRNFSQTNPDFTRWQQENQIFNPQQCTSITFASQQTRPETALQGEARAQAATQQCVALYDGYKHANLPSIDALVAAVANDPSARLFARQMQHDFAQHRPGKIYFPGSNLPLDGALITSMMVNKDTLTSVQAGIILEAYQACITEATTRFDESLRDWQDVTDSATIAARTAPLQKLCQARFARDNTRQQRLEEFKRIKARLTEEQAALEQQKNALLPKRKPLIPFACPVEGG